MRWSRALGCGLALACLPGAAGASSWPLAGGDASRSGNQAASGGELPATPVWNRDDRGIRTPVVITGGVPAVQRVAYGTIDGRVRLRVLGSGVEVREGGTQVVNAVVDQDPSDTFGSRAAAVGFADTSTAERLGVLYVVHNDGDGVEIARLDLATGGRIDTTDIAVAESLGCEVTGSPVLSPPDATGGRVLFLTLRGSCAADSSVVRVPIEGDAASPSATVDPADQAFARVDGIAEGVGPSLVVLRDGQGAPRFYVGIGRANGVDFFDASKPLDARPGITPRTPDLSVALPAGETAMTVSGPATASGLVAGAEGSGTPAAGALYVAAAAGGQTRVHRIVQRPDGTLALGGSTAPLPNAGTPAPALAVAETVAPAGTSPGGRIVVTSSQNLTVLRTSDLSSVGQISANPLPDGRGFRRTVAAVSGGFAFAMRDGAATTAAAEHVALRLETGLEIGSSDFQRAAVGPGAGAGQPAIARGRVVFGSPSGAVAYALRDVTKPTVELLEPAAGTRLGPEPVRLVARAGDDQDVASVSFRLVGGGAPRTIGRATGPEPGTSTRYAATADVSGVSSGAFELEAVAVDAAGNTAYSLRRRVTVARGVRVKPSRAACLNDVFGTPASDRLTGSRLGDRILGGDGHDRLYGGAGHDCLDGGAGNDRLSGGRGNDRLEGGRGRDKLAGDGGRNRLIGGPGGDSLRGGNLADSLEGGGGNDRLSGGGGRNRYSGGRGKDVIYAVNGARDRVRCGRGRDHVTAEPADRVARDCERVVRTSRR